MFPQVFPYPQIHPSEVATYADDLATNPFIPTMSDDLILMGEIVYNYLASEANGTPDQWYPDWLGYSPLPEDTYGGLDHLYFASPATSHSSINTPPFSPSPSPPLSQASSTSERHSSPEPSSTPEPGCGKGTPVFNHIRRKWCCSACDKDFRGKWECKRHIEVTGKRAVCLACGGNLSRRDDSLQRHYKKYCKNGARNLRFEDAFIEV